MDCSEVLKQLADFLDEDLRDELCAALEKHLADCKDCRYHVDSVRKTIILYHESPNPARGVDVPRAVSAQLQQALDQEYRAARKND